MLLEIQRSNVMCHATGFLFLGQFFRKEFKRGLDFCICSI